MISHCVAAWMVEVWLPYGGAEVPVRIPDEQLVAVLEPPPADKDLKTALEGGLESPQGSGRLEDQLKRGGKVAIAIDELLLRGRTAPFFPLLLQELVDQGLDKEKAIVVVARDPGRMVKANLDPASLGLPVELHDHHTSETEPVTVGSSELLLNKRFMEADFRILVGEVRPELGEFRGTDQLILRGLTGVECLRMGYGPIFRGNSTFTADDIYAALKEVFAIEVLCDSRRNIVDVISGGTDARRKAVDEAQRRSRHPVEKKVDIVVASAGGDPFDTDLYTASTLLGNAIGILNQDGIVVFAAECANGYGDAKFLDWIKKFESSKELERSLTKEFDPVGCVALALLKGIERAKVYLASILPDSYTSGMFGMRPAKTANAGLQSALRAAGKDAKIAAVPSCAVSLPELMAN